jgi:hypothetical protein
MNVKIDTTTMRERVKTGATTVRKCFIVAKIFRRVVVLTAGES